MFGILDRYIGKNIIAAVIVIAVALTLLTGIITLIDKTRYIGRGSVDFLFVCWYLALQLPGFFVNLFPVAVLLGGVIGLGNLARNSEIIVMQSIGLSRVNIALSSLKLIIPLIAVVMAIGEYIVPNAESYAETKLTEVSTNGRVTVNKSGIWLREGNSFIAVQAAMTDGSLSNIVRYDVEGNELVSLSRARRGIYDKKSGQWVMDTVNTEQFTPEGVIRTRTGRQVWKLNLNPERVDIIGNSSNFLTISGLIDYVSYLEDNNQDSSRYRLELYNKLLAPVAVIVMLMLALSTVFGPLRSMSMGTRVLIGIGLGFGFYVVNQILGPFSLVYGIPPFLGASVAIILFGVLAFVLLRRKV